MRGFVKWLKMEAQCRGCRAASQPRAGRAFVWVRRSATSGRRESGLVSGPAQGQPQPAARGLGDHNIQPTRFLFGPSSHTPPSPVVTIRRPHPIFSRTPAIAAGIAGVMGGDI